MDKKQPLLLIMVMVIFGIGIASALWVFGQRNVSAHREEILNDLNHIAAHMYQFRLRPTELGGGGGTYFGYKIPDKLASNEVATFSIIEHASPDTMTIEARSVHNLGVVTAMINATGQLSGHRFTGEFAE
jgi:hypothetical protein